ncbi:MAG: DUF6049 family protein [Actinomycetota bacterium]|nr:DUF6049 family protein [Actinomycetota bacterium]
MTPPVCLSIGACLATGFLAGAVLVLAGSGAVAAADSTPLQVSVDSLSPAAIPSRGEITVTGQITNISDDMWSDLNVYLLTSPAPFTTSDELAEAALSDPASDIGNRLTAAELFDPVGDLAPGSSVGYTLSVGRKDLDLIGQAGVYWLGVHVLGANRDGRDSVADGRGRTFVPLMERGGPDTSMSLVMPIKADVRRKPDGRLRELRTWQELLSPEGRLGRLLEISGTSLDIPVTWVLDPAVADAARSVASDNPPLSTERTQRGDEPGTDPSESPDAEPAPAEPPSEEPSEEPSDEPSDEAPSGADVPAPSVRALQAAAWLDTFRRQSQQHSVLTVPYGDLDVASLLRRNFVDLVGEATRLSAGTMADLDVEAEGVVAPPSGFLPGTAVTALDPGTSVLLSQAAAPGAPTTVLLTTKGHRIVLADSSVKAGGPPPAPPYRALALRQRILSEAAVHALSVQNQEPLVMSTPQLWDPGSDWRRAEFFSGLEAPWIRAVDLPTVIVTGGALGSDPGPFDVKLDYPRSEAQAELPVTNPLASEMLSETGKVLATLLSQNDTVDEVLSKSAMLASSFQARKHPDASVELARRTTARVRSRLLDRVRVEGPSFVTMSGKEGPFAITLVNDLDEPVTVGIEAVTDSSELVIPSPEPVSLGSGQRATVRLRATSQDIGVHAVSLFATNSKGQRLGNEVQFNVRSSQVGLVIWAVMGLGVGVLFLAAGVRLVRRVQTKRMQPS